MRCPTAVFPPVLAERATLVGHVRRHGLGRDAGAGPGRLLDGRPALGPDRGGRRRCGWWRCRRRCWPPCRIGRPPRHRRHPHPSSRRPSTPAVLDEALPMASLCPVLATASPPLSTADDWSVSGDRSTGDRAGLGHRRRGAIAHRRGVAGRDGRAVPSESFWARPKLPATLTSVAAPACARLADVGTVLGAVADGLVVAGVGEGLALVAHVGALVQDPYAAGPTISTRGGLVHRCGRGVPDRGGGTGAHGCRAVGRVRRLTVVGGDRHRRGDGNQEGLKRFVGPRLPLRLPG